MSVFGTYLVLPDEPERAIEALLKQWLPDYLAEIARRTSRNQPLKAIQAWGFGDLDNGLEDGNLPRLMIECDAGTMIGHGDHYGCQWDSAVRVVVRSMYSMAHVRQLAQAYITAISLALIQQDAYVGTGENRQLMSVSWETQAPSIRDISTRRWIAQAEATFTLTVPIVAEISAGPDVPSEDPAVPPGEYPDVEHVGLTVDGTAVPNFQ